MDFDDSEIVGVSFDFGKIKNNQKGYDWFKIWTKWIFGKWAKV